jgi:hypothetical protein
LVVAWARGLKVVIFISSVAMSAGFDLGWVSRKIAKTWICEYFHDFKTR